jgi:hypothetical protein
MLEAEHTKSILIIPQLTDDGVILIDWYATDDPENPQNWSSLKKGIVVFILCLYTWTVYLPRRTHLCRFRRKWAPGRIPCQSSGCFAWPVALCSGLWRRRPCVVTDHRDPGRWKKVRLLSDVLRLLGAVFWSHGCQQLRRAARTAVLSCFLREPCLSQWRSDSGRLVLSHIYPVRPLLVGALRLVWSGPWPPRRWLCSNGQGLAVADVGGCVACVAIAAHPYLLHAVDFELKHSAQASTPPARIDRRLEASIVGRDRPAQSLF